MSPITPVIYDRLRERTLAASTAVKNSSDDQKLVYKRARYGAKKRGIEFHLTEFEFDILTTRSNSRCEETGVYFEDDTNNTGNYCDNRMSIDRLDSNLPYTLDNCRLVTIAANLSKRDLTIESLHIQRLLYIIELGYHIDERFIEERIGIDPINWKY